MAVGKRKTPVWAHLLVGLGAFVFVIAGGGAIAVQFTINKLNTAVETEDILGANREEMSFDGGDVKGPLNFLVLGQDKDQGGAVRSDTMIIVHLNETLDEMTMVSIPRDLKVDVRECWDGTPCSTKITESSGFHDDPVASYKNVTDAIYDLSGIKFNGAANVKFEGFLELIDTVGDVNLCLWADLITDHSKVVYEKGCNDYNKEEALEIVRTRKGWDGENWGIGRGGDYGRQAMQQQAIMAILRNAKEKGYHTDPVKVVEIFEGFGENLTLDIGEVELGDLIIAARDIDPENILRLQVPSTTETIDGTSYVIMSEFEGHDVAAGELWQSILNDTPKDWAAANPQWLIEDL